MLKNRRKRFFENLIYYIVNRLEFSEKLIRECEKFFENKHAGRNRELYLSQLILVIGLFDTDFPRRHLSFYIMECGNAYLSECRGYRNFCEKEIRIFLATGVEPSLDLIKKAWVEGRRKRPNLMGTYNLLLEYSNLNDEQRGELDQTIRRLTQHN